MSAYQFERIQQGMYRVKTAVGYIGVVSGKSGDWRAETKRSPLPDRFKSRRLAAHALNGNRQG
jgi:hypothetical protein